MGANVGGSAAPAPGIDDEVRLTVSARLADEAGVLDDFRRLVMRLHAHARSSGDAELERTSFEVLERLAGEFGARHPDALSEAESRVAHRAAEGRSNREISEELFVTVKTVEFHLSNVFRKLGIAQRSELAGSLIRQFTE